MYAGVDEAGRGPVLGPLVVAGVAGSPAALPDGIADSKTLTPERRRRLRAQVEASNGLDVALREIPVSELNERMDAGDNLDTIETDAFSAVLTELGAERAVVDTIGSDPDAFGASLTERLDGACEVTALKGADARDPVVGAASIVAKVTRDDAIDAIEQELGEPIGSGYPSDPTTRAFLESWRRTSAHPPPFARTAWSTLESFGFGTRTLNEFDRPRRAQR